MSGFGKCKKSPMKSVAILVGLVDKRQREHTNCKNITVDGRYIDLCAIYLYIYI